MSAANAMRGGRAGRAESGSNNGEVCLDGDSEATASTIERLFVWMTPLPKVVRVSARCGYCPARLRVLKGRSFFVSPSRDPLCEVRGCASCPLYWRPQLSNKC